MTGHTLVLSDLRLHLIATVFKHWLPSASLLRLASVSQVVHSLSATPTTYTNGSDIIIEEVMLTLRPVEAHSTLVLLATRKIMPERLVLIEWVCSEEQRVILLLRL